MSSPGYLQFKSRDNAPGGIGDEKVAGAEETPAQVASSEKL